MLKFLRNIAARFGKGISQAVILIAALTFISDAFANIEVSHVGNSISVHSISDSSSPDSADDEHPCHQHCQTLLEKSSSLVFIYTSSLAKVKKIATPSSPFLDRVPRPPTV